MKSAGSSGCDIGDTPAKSRNNTGQDAVQIKTFHDRIRRAKSKAKLKPRVEKEMRTKEKKETTEKRKNDEKFRRPPPNQEKTMAHRPTFAGYTHGLQISAVFAVFAGLLQCDVQATNGSLKTTIS